VTSNHKGNPYGNFTTVGIYYIILMSDVYLLFANRIRYAEDPIPFSDIYRWVSEYAFDIVSERVPYSAYLVDVVAYTFERTQRKPTRISAG